MSIWRSSPNVDEQHGQDGVKQHTNSTKQQNMSPAMIFGSQILVTNACLEQLSITWAQCYVHDTTMCIQSHEEMLMLMT